MTKFISRSLLGFFAMAVTAGAALAETYTDMGKAPSGTYTMDKTHGYVTFTYSHGGYSNPYLRFRDIDAKLNLDSASIDKSSVEVTINAASIDSGVDAFDDHLNGAKFFDTANHPTITFKSTDVSVDDGKITMVGDVTIKGKTTPITFTGKLNKGGLHRRSGKPILGFSASSNIKRSEYGVDTFAMVGNDVKIIIEAEFNKQD